MEYEKKKKEKKKEKKKARSRDSGAHRKGGLGSQSGPAYSILPFPSSKPKNFLFFRIIALDQRTTARSAASLLSPLPPSPLSSHESPNNDFPHVQAPFNRHNAENCGDCGQRERRRSSSRGGWWWGERKEFLRACQPFVIANGSRLTKVS